MKAIRELRPVKDLRQNREGRVMKGITKAKEILLGMTNAGREEKARHQLETKQGSGFSQNP